jgi:hypothetical protein
MLGGALGLQELVVLAVIFGLVVVLPATVVLVALYCLRRDGRSQGGV